MGKTAEVSLRPRRHPISFGLVSRAQVELFKGGNVIQMSKAQTSKAEAIKRVEKSPDEWRKELSPEQYAVTREAGTEAAFSGEYCNNKKEGTYRCVCCGAPLFASETKYESHSGWPSYWEPIEGEAVVEHEDRSHGMVRTEVTCSTCDAHLGHVFPDGPRPTGLRYCINSLSLDFEEGSES